MGVYECPVDECKVVANSANPRTKRTKHRQPDGACGDGMCHVHKEELVHRPCDAFWRCYSFPPDNVHPNGYTRVEHQGDHDHARPHEKLSKNARAAFVEHVQSNVDLFPTQLKMGFNQIKPSSELHPRLNNTGTVGYERRKVIKQKNLDNPPFALKDIVTWEQDIGKEFLMNKCFDSKNACISIQFPHMQLIAKDNRKYAFQTDTLENWIQDIKHPNMSVTVTSTYCELLGRHVPVFMSITYGRTANHYQSHFEKFIQYLEYQSFEEFKETFPGNIR